MARFLVVIGLHNYTLPRVQKAVPEIKGLLEKLSKEAPELAFRAVDNSVFAFCIISDKTASHLQAIIEAPNRAASYEIKTLPVLEGDDTLLVLEIGEQAAAGKGFSRFVTWLQHHKG
jgi:hypothetical protein